MSEGLTAAALISIITSSSPRDNCRRSTTGATSAGVPAFTFSRAQRASTDIGWVFALFSDSIVLSDHGRISTLSAVFVHATMPVPEQDHRDARRSNGSD